MNHWQDDPRRVFELARNAHAPPKGAKQRGRKKLDAKLAAMVATGVGVSSAKGALLAFTGSKAPLVTVFFIGAATAGYAGGIVIAHSRAVHSSVASMKATPAARLASSARPAASVSQLAAPVAVEVSAASSTRTPNISFEARRSGEVNQVVALELSATDQGALESRTRLTEEAELIRLANQALGLGHVTQAMAILDKHAREFPTGALSEEREAAQIMAACQLGRGADAQAQFDTFTENWPRSPHRARVRGACGW